MKLRFKIDVKGIFKKGDIVDLNIIRYNKGDIITPATYYYDHKTKVPYSFNTMDYELPEKKLFTPEVIANGTEYKSYTITDKNNNTYSEDCLSNLLGVNNSRLSNMFEKII